MYNYVQMKTNERKIMTIMNLFMKISIDLLNFTCIPPVYLYTFTPGRLYVKEGQRKWMMKRTDT